MVKRFDYAGAKKEGYSDEEIMQHLQQSRPNFDFEGAIQEGYSPAEINEYLSQPPKRSSIAKAGRIAGQFALGRAENALMPYELAVAPLASKEAQHGEYRQRLFEDIDRLQEQKASGQWDEQDQVLYDSLVDQVKNPEKAEQFVKTADIGVRGLAEKATGLDLHPEGVLEKAANWTAFVKKPANLKELAATGLKLKDVVKAISPTGQESIRGLGAGLGLELAEEGKFGPLGTMTAAIVGDIASGGVPSVIKSLRHPIKTSAKLLSSLIPSEQKALQQQIIKEFRDAGVTADLGTITDNKLIKAVQARLTASGLTGEASEKLKQQITSEIVDGYKKIANDLGEARFVTERDAAEAGKRMLTDIRDAEKSRISDMYNKSRARLNEKSVVNPTKLAASIQKLEHSLKPGAVKSTEQKAVLDILEKLKSDIHDAEGRLKPASVQDLLNNKIALNDIINFEVQGGQKQLLRKLQSDIDRMILSYGHRDPEFLKNYAKANEEFAEHAKIFRNDNINQVLTKEDPQLLINKFNTVQGIKDLKKALGKSKEGKKLFDDLSRLKLDSIIEKNMVDGVSNQLKLGTFSNLLNKGKNKEIVHELLSPEAFSNLTRLQKISGRLAESAQKFFNASKTGTVQLDTKALTHILGILNGIPALLSGNIWMLAPYGGIIGARYLNKMISDPKFLRLVGDMVLATEKNDAKRMQKIAEAILERAAPTINAERNQ
jgi:hypothetical protein